MNKQLEIFLQKEANVVLHRAHKYIFLLSIINLYNLNPERE